MTRCFWFIDLTRVYRKLNKDNQKDPLVPRASFDIDLSTLFIGCGFLLWAATNFNSRSCRSDYDRAGVLPLGSSS